MIEAKTMTRTFTVVRKGRKRKPGVPRDAKGRIASGFDRERPEEIRRVVEMQPHRRHRKDVTVDGKTIKRSDPLYGYALGRLLVAGMGHKGDGLTQDQHDAGVWFTSLYKANARLRGWPNQNVKSPSTILLAAGLDCLPDDDPERIIAVRRRWQDAYRAIFDVQKDFGPVFEALKRACVEDLDPANAGELGALRLALNALARIRRKT
jgi:hypothetical protein